jgi:hypothetical protein
VDVGIYFTASNDEIVLPAVTQLMFQDKLGDYFSTIKCKEPF